MTRWAQGESEVEALIAAGHLQVVSGAAADGRSWLDRAERTIDSAAALIASDPTSAYVLAYDAVRNGCTALLVQQGLRPTSSGGHVAVEKAVRAQFGQPFRPFGGLRRRRHELEYPAYPDDLADSVEASDAVEDARAMIEAAGKVLGHLEFFRR